MGDHSKWTSPSGIHRLILCPGSPLAVQTAIERMRIPAQEPESPYAAEGTMLHDIVYDIMEKKDRTKYEALTDDQKDWVDFAVKTVSDLLLSEGSSMLYGNPKVANELRVDLGRKAEDVPPEVGPLFGTLDRATYAKHNHHLRIIDYKFGRGEVQAEENDQMQCYAFMALQSWDVIERFPPVDLRITLTILQPRVSQKIKTWETDLNGLKTWWKTKALHALKQSVGHNPVRIPSEDACRWCRVNGICEAQERKYTHFIKNNPLTDPELVKDRQRINDLGLMLPEIDIWSKGLASHLLDYVQDDIGLPDFKAVRGRQGNKAYIDEDKADKFLARQGLKKDERTVTKLITPAAAEKELKKRGAAAKAFTTFKNYYEQKEGKITFALKGDPRPEVKVSKNEDAVNAMDAAQDSGAVGNPEPSEKSSQPTQSTQPAQPKKTLLL